MKKLLLLCLLFSVCSMVSFAAVDGQSGTKVVTGDAAKALFKRMNGLDAAEKTTLINNRISKSRVANKAVLKASTDIDASLAGESFSFLMGPDGTQWCYTQTFDANGYYYTGSTIKFYDSEHTLKGEVYVDVTDISNVNQIAVSTDVTNTFYDTDASTNEITLWYHTALNGVTSIVTRVYRLNSEQGELIYETEGSSILLDLSADEYNPYLRLLIVTDTTMTVEEDGSSVSKDYDIINVLRPIEEGEDTMTIEHQFFIDIDKTYYMNGSDINYWLIDGEPYFTIAHYEKDYVSSYTYDSSSGSFDLVTTDDNSFVVKVYDRNYNLVDSLYAPIETPEDTYLRMAAFGLMSDYDLAKDYFNPGGFSYVIVWDDYLSASDADRYEFKAYGSNNEYLATVCDNVYNEYYMLAPVKGYEDQMMFMQIVDDEEMITMVDIPSCNVITTLPSTIEDELISTEMNRHGVNGTYQYIVKLGYATSDDEGNTIARLGWYNTSAELDHYTSFNLTSYGEDFTPGLYDNMLNPYVFDADAEMEYVYFAKISNDSSTTVYDYVYVANEDGSEILAVGPDSEKGTIRIAYVLTEGVPQPELVVGFIDSGYDNYTIDFYPLPIGGVTLEGSGTSSDPYLISTPVELIQIGKNVDAYYKVVADIDMSEYPLGWETISQFTGSIDGDGHAISNLSITGDDYYTGMFGYLTSGASISNLSFINPSLTVDGDNAYAGIISGCMLNASLDNVHIYDGLIKEPTASAVMSAVGGLVGQASSYSSFESCSFEGEITAPAAENVGGIVGYTRTTSTVNNAAVEAVITGGSYVGGIVGTAYGSSDVTNSHADVQLTAGNNVGGIIGYNGGRVTIEKCYAEGSILADTQPKWNGMNVGGIVGDLETDWSQLSATSATAVVKQCVADINLTITAGEDDDDTKHRIVGSTIINETWGNGETPQKELGLADNYAVSTMTINDSTIESDDATSTDGASIDASELNNAFFADSLGYAYGSDATSPWKGESGLPVLYYEDIASLLFINTELVNIKVDQTQDITVTVYGVDASNIQADCSNTEVAEIEIADEGDNYVTLTVIGVAVGEAVITATCDDLAVSCAVNVSEVATEEETGISNITDGNGSQTVSISFADGQIKANGARNLIVYSTDGRRMAATEGTSIDAGSLASGVYIVTATDAQGNTTTSKLAVK